MTLVKICGITNLEDALGAVAAGADALGFNFYQPSPRYIEPNTARAIVEELPETVWKVGVFVNEESPEDVRRIASAAGMTAVQLHGDESPEYCAELTEYFVIKVIAATDGNREPLTRKVLSYDVDAIMLDAGDKRTRGGTGRVIDWSTAAKVRQLVPRLFLAGGLSAENVVEAIEVVDPFAVDACSLLEDLPGKKNHESMKAFVARARDVKP